MKKLISKFALLFLAVFFLSCIIQAVSCFAIRLFRIGDFGVLNAINNGMINSELLICGSSRGYYHYNPEILGKMTRMSCYNISQNGTDLGIQIPFLNWYLDKNQSPRYLIQNIDVFIGDISPTIYEPFKYLPYINNKELYHGLLRIDQQWWFHKFIPISNLIYFGKDFQNKLIKESYQFILKKPDYLVRGYYPRKSHWVGGQYETNFLREHSRGLQYRISNAHQQYLSELMKICRTYRIQLIFVISPEYGEFMSLQTNRKEIIDYYVHLSQENNIWFFDYSKSDLCYNKKYFYNFTHMNSDGADMFSTDLALKLRMRISLR